LQLKEPEILYLTIPEIFEPLIITS
jgi:hypothetical protein